MRYLIVTYDDYFNIPYIQYYENFLKKQNQSYDIVLWNRSGQQVDLPNAYVFSAKDRHSKLGKIRPFLGWRRFVLRILKTQQYDRLIILTTMPAILLADQLLGKYKNRFWLDIRDFTYENVPPYKKLVEKLVYAASAVSISSGAFRSFLPESDNIYLTHNISNQEFAEEHCTLDIGQRPIQIGFVGGIQFVAQNQMLLQQFANHPGYRLKYVGKAHLGCDLKPFCVKNSILNADFYPAFTNDQKPAIYRDIQLINCIYGNHNPVVRLLLPNRLYDCVLFKKPILVSKGTYLADVVEAYHLGIPVDVANENVVQAVENYLISFDRSLFEQGCRQFLKKVETEIAAYTQVLERFCADTHYAETH